MEICGIQWGKHDVPYSFQHTYLKDEDVRVWEGDIDDHILIGIFPWEKMEA